MQQTDDAVAALTGSDGFTAMSRTERLDAALEQLEQLAAKGLVSARSILVDEENGMVSFAITPAGCRAAFWWTTSTRKTPP